MLLEWAKFAEKMELNPKLALPWLEAYELQLSILYSQIEDPFTPAPPPHDLWMVFEKRPHRTTNHTCRDKCKHLAYQPGQSFHSHFLGRIFSASGRARICMKTFHVHVCGEDCLTNETDAEGYCPISGLATLDVISRDAPWKSYRRGHQQKTTNGEHGDGKEEDGEKIADDDDEKDDVEDDEIDDDEPEIVVMSDDEDDVIEIDPIEIDHNTEKLFHSDGEIDEDSEREEVTTTAPPPPAPTLTNAPTVVKALTMMDAREYVLANPNRRLMHNQVFDVLLACQTDHNQHAYSQPDEVISQQKETELVRYAKACIKAKPYVVPCRFHAWQLWQAEDLKYRKPKKQPKQRQRRLVFYTEFIIYYWRILVPYLYPDAMADACEDWQWRERLERFALRLVELLQKGIVREAVGGNIIQVLPWEPYLHEHLDVKNVGRNSRVKDNNRVFEGKKEVDVCLRRLPEEIIANQLSKTAIRKAIMPLVKNICINGVNAVFPA